MQIGDTPYIDATDELQKYRIALRDFWNQYVWSDPDMRDWDMADVFDDLRQMLWSRLVGEKLRKRMDADGNAQFTVFIVPAIRELGGWHSPIRISETALKETSRYWNQPPSIVWFDDMQLRFLDFFDWSRCSYRDFQYHLVEISASPRYPDLIGREALIEVGNTKAIAFATAATTSHADVLSAAESLWPEWGPITRSTHP